MTDASDETVTAALLVIGDEILSGRTKDKNIGTIADHCTMIGNRCSSRPEPHQVFPPATSI